MKHIITFLIAAMGLGLPVFAQEIYRTPAESSSEEYGLLQGKMTFNSWNGKIYIGGAAVANSDLGLYFGPEELSQFKNNRILYFTGLVTSTVGALATSYSLGYTFGWLIVGGSFNDMQMGAAKVMFIAGVPLLVAGLAMGIPAERKINRTIAGYNNTKGYESYLSFGPTPNGIGLALTF